MEELEKELNKDCNCCDGCTCGEDCNCTEDNKCCEECTCDKHCDCECDDTECKCEDINDESKAEDVDNDEYQNDDSDECTCGANIDDEENECNDEVDSKCACECESEEDKCQCGCGEKIEDENVSDTYFKQLLSLKAEFDNYRKRTQNDIAKAYSNGFNQAITEFLPALDSFKMATEYITDANTLMGIQYIEKGILNTLEKIGVKAIDVSGKFDPNFHQAIGSEVSPEHKSGDIIKECFKGFIMGDKVIRYSQVIVAK